jgi:hypothetical protein
MIMPQIDIPEGIKMAYSYHATLETVGLEAEEFDDDVEDEDDDDE